MIAALVVAAALTQADWAAKPLALEPELYAVAQTGRRAVDWYRHTGDPAWGDAVTNFVDRFSVVKPVAGDAANAPLIVVLHWRGAGWPGKGVDLQTRLADEKDRVFSAPDDFYILNLDDIRSYHVLWNRTHEQYWWGATSAYGGPTVKDVPRLAAGETPCERRVLDTVEWTIRRYGLDRNRIYLCGNSMGAQAAEAIGLAHGEIFAAVNANVPATVWFAAARLGFVDADGSETERSASGAFADPPPVVDWSGVDDVWSRDREIFYRGMARRHWALIGLWGDFGHCGVVSAARAKNELIERFDWLSIRRDAAYPAFTHADSDDRLPWPFKTWRPKIARFGGWKGDVESAEMEIAEEAKPSGQVNAFFRWRNLRDDDDIFAMELHVASAEELQAERVVPPEAVTADVTVWRLQSPALREARRFVWVFGEQSGSVERGEDGALTIPALRLTRSPKELRLQPLSHPMS